MSGKYLSCKLYGLCCGLILLSFLTLLVREFLPALLPFKAVYYSMGGCALGMFGLYLLRPQEPGKSASRTPYNTHAPKSDKPVWRNIPSHATLLLDTNVLMCPDENIRSWFGYLLHNAKQHDWRIVIIGAVYEEVMHHLKHGNENKAKDARLARNRIELMTDELGDYLQMHGLNHQAAAVTDSRYADPQLIDYMCTHKRTFLFTFDNDLKIRCKHLIRSTQPKNLVFSEEDFYA